MTQSDKDFITRIQVSQLVTEDPYNEDFYAQVYSSFVRSRMGPTAQTQKSILRLAGGAGVGVGIPGHRGAGRRENAMARMQNQVERIVKNAQARQKDVSAGMWNSLTVILILIRSHLVSQSSGCFGKGFGSKLQSCSASDASGGYERH